MDIDLQSSSSGFTSTPAVTAENPIVPLFLVKTYAILETSPEDVICWSDEGDSFIVKDVQRFTAEVIPLHFNHNKFASFVRQLNFYGFRKVKGKLTFVGTSEQHSWEFKHPSFLRGHPDLLFEIKRSTSRPAEPTTATGCEAETVQSMRRQIDALTRKVSDMAAAAAEMQKVIEGYQRELQGGPEEARPGAADLCDIDDEELLMTFIEDLKDLSVPTAAPAMRTEGTGILKRQRSVDTISALLEGRPRSVAKASRAADATCSAPADLQDPAVVTAVANAIALSAQAGGPVASVSFDQYVSAVGAILSCAGMAQTQAAAMTAKKDSDVKSSIVPPPTRVSAVV